MGDSSFYDHNPQLHLPEGEKHFRFFVARKSINSNIKRRTHFPCGHGFVERCRSRCGFVSGAIKIWKRQSAGGYARAWRSAREKRKKLLGRIEECLGTNCALLHYEATLNQTRFIYASSPTIFIYINIQSDICLHCYLFESKLWFMRKKYSWCEKKMQKTLFSASQWQINPGWFFHFPTLIRAQLQPLGAAGVKMVAGGYTDKNLPTITSSPAVPLPPPCILMPRKCAGSHKLDLPLILRREQRRVKFWGEF